MLLAKLLCLPYLQSMKNHVCKSMFYEFYHLLVITTNLFIGPIKQQFLAKAI